jgi:Domain of unknown function (DUF4166)
LEVKSRVPPLYRRLLGEAFETLPAALRDFHGRAGGGTARGVLCVTRGKGWLANALADRMRLPAQGDQVAMRLRVLVEGDRERWVRDFDGVRMETGQWLHAGLLVEAAGPLRAGFRVAAGLEGLRFELARAWLFALPLPRALVPHTTAEARAEESGWRIDVRVEAPFIGLLARYHGGVVPE